MAFSHGIILVISSLYDLIYPFPNRSVRDGVVKVRTVATETILSNSHQRYSAIGCDSSPRPNNEKVATEAQELYFQTLRPRTSFCAHVHAGRAANKRFPCLYEKQATQFDLGGNSKR